MKLVFYILILSLSVSCFKVSKEKGIHDFYLKIKDEAIYWNDKQIKNLVDERFSIEVIYPESIYAFGYCGFFIDVKYNNTDEFLQRFNYLSGNSIFHESLYNCCNKFVLGNLACQNNMNCDENSPILPDINGKFSPLVKRENKIDSTSVVLVFDEGQGLFLNDSEITPSDSKITLPENLNHGFSVGAIVDTVNQNVTYWEILW